MPFAAPRLLFDLRWRVQVPQDRAGKGEGEIEDEDDDEDEDEDEDEGGTRKKADREERSFE